MRSGLLSIPPGILMRPCISQGYIKDKQRVPEQGYCKLPKGLVSCAAPRFFGALGGTPQWCGYLGVTQGPVNSSKKLLSSPGWSSVESVVCWYHLSEADRYSSYFFVSPQRQILHSRHKHLWDGCGNEDSSLPVLPWFCLPSVQKNMQQEGGSGMGLMWGPA